jgi:hypothetical protein
MTAADIRAETGPLGQCVVYTDPFPIRNRPTTRRDAAAGGATEEGDRFLGRG